VRHEHDPAKLAANVRKHGVWFEEAEEFERETALLVVDTARRTGNRDCWRLDTSAIVCT
jgi:uncharacterized DUF497 family protein